MLYLQDTFNTTLPKLKVIVELTFYKITFHADNLFVPQLKLEQFL